MNLGRLRRAFGNAKAPRRARPTTRARRTIRTRLTLTYTALMLLFATSVTVAVYLFMRYATSYAFAGTTAEPPGTPVLSPPPSSQLAQATPVPGGLVVTSPDSLFNVLLIASVVALAVLGVAAAAVGWIVTGRMLRPLQDITAAAQRAGTGDLHHRIALTGPKDELKDLADTFDGMLARLERAFKAHRRFAANASHELRTPLATTQAVLDVALAEPQTQDVRTLALKLRDVNTHSIDVIDALLDLADLDHTHMPMESTVLSRLVHDAAATVAPEAAGVGVRMDLRLDEDCVVRAAPTLLRQLVLNLLQNAVRHNIPSGSVTVATVVHAGGVTLEIRNTGRPIPPDAVPLLTEPFYRTAGRTNRNRGGAIRGHGLGLTLAASIAAVHGTRLRLTANQGGGLTAQIDLPVESRIWHTASA